MQGQSWVVMAYGRELVSSIAFSEFAGGEESLEVRVSGALVKRQDGGELA